MKRLFGLAFLVSAIAAFPLLALAGANPQQGPQQQGAQQHGAAQTGSAQRAPSGGADRGQQVFDQNCSRCHNPPEGFSPRISGTVALHMRVRANLSSEDYKALLHFLNP